MEKLVFLPLKHDEPCDVDQGQKHAHEEARDDQVCAQGEDPFLGGRPVLSVGRLSEHG